MEGEPSHDLAPDQLPTPHLLTLGRFALTGESDEPLLGRGKPLAILTFLVGATRHEATRDRLVDLCWGEGDPDRGRHSLRQALVTIRRALGADAIHTDDELVRLVRVPSNDRDSFLQALKKGDDKAAISLYAGDFLSDFAIPGGGPFDSWADLERRQLRRLFVDAAERETRRLLSTADLGAAEQLARRVRDAEVEDQSGWRLLLEVLALAGDRIQLQLESEALSSLLAEEERTAEPATVALLRRVSSTTIPLLPTAEGPECVGRDREFGALLAAWERTRARRRMVGVRITAASGYGKSRLLQELRTRVRAAGGRAVLVGARIDERDLAGAFAADVVGALGALKGSAGVTTASAALLVGLAPSLSGRIMAAPEIPQGADGVRRRALAIADLIEAVTSEAPLVLLLDDVQWCDAESREMLHAALNRVHESAMLVIAADRGTQTVLEGEVEQLSLAPLTEEDLVALLASMGVLPTDEGGFLHFARELVQAADGSPLLILQALEGLRAKGLLSLEHGRWELKSDAALFVRAAKSGSLVARIESLSAGLREVLLRLAVLGDALPTDLVDENEEAALQELERIALALRNARGWRVAHDAIAEASRAAASDEERTAAGRSMAKAIARDDYASARMLARAGRLFVQSGDVEEAALVLRRWVRVERVPDDTRSARQFASSFLGRAIQDPLVKRLARSVPVSGRLRQRIALGFVGLAVTAVLIVAWQQSRLPHLSILEEPMFEGMDTSRVTIPGAVLVTDRQGRLVDRSDDTVEVSLTDATSPSLVLLGVLRSPLLNGIATFPDLALTGMGSGRLRFVSRRYGDVLSQPQRLDGARFPNPKLFIRGGSLNGQTLDSLAPTLTLPLGTDSIIGGLRMRYDRYQSTAGILLVATSSWEPRDRGCRAVDALLPRARNAIRDVRVRLPAPRSLGEHLLVFAHAAEPSRHFICSQTNWKLESPRWNDGRDLLDLSPEEIIQANRTGTLLRRWDFWNEAQPHVDAYPIGAAVIRVRITAP